MLAKNYKILCVDDEPFILSLLGRILSLEGYQVLTAQSATQAIEMISNNQIDLVISDYLMPELTGTQLVEKIHLIAPQCIKIILTGQANENEIDKAIESGLIVKCLEKPISGQIFKKEIQDLLFGLPERKQA